VAVIAAVHGPTRVAARGRLGLYSAASGDDVDVSGACSSNCFDIAFRKKRKFVHQTLYMGCRQRISDCCSQHSTQSASEPPDRGKISKSLRRSLGRAQGLLHLISAWASAQGLGFGQILERGPAYLLVLKANHGKGFLAVWECCDQRCFACGATVKPMFDAFNDSLGRLVRQRVFVCPEAANLEALDGWPRLRTVLAVEIIHTPSCSQNWWVKPIAPVGGTISAGDFRWVGHTNLPKSHITTWCKQCRSAGSGLGCHINDVST
jgi:hypothetical protein